MFDHVAVGLRALERRGHVLQVVEAEQRRGRLLVVLDVPRRVRDEERVRPDVLVVASQDQRGVGGAPTEAAPAPGGATMFF